MLKSLEKQTLTFRNHTCKHKFISVIFIFGPEMQCLGDSSLKNRLYIFNIIAQHAIQTYRKINMSIFVAKPNHPHISYYERASVSIVALGVLHVIHGVNDLLPSVHCQLGHGNIESDFAVDPEEIRYFRNIFGNVNFLCFRWHFLNTSMREFISGHYLL